MLYSPSQVWHLLGWFADHAVAPSRVDVTYDPGRMSRSVRYAFCLLAALGVAFVVSACGTQHVGVPKTDPKYNADTQAAHLFNQRCGGCHTLSYAGTHGSGQNPRTYEAINGPNFNVRCERPEIRVYYAIINGGFGGGIMPQNVVVGKQALELAHFVAKYSGRQAPVEPGTTACENKAIGSLATVAAG